jgi:hypothetical protein
MDIQNILDNYKKCTKCHTAKEITEFNKLRGECKGCRKKINQDYYHCIKAKKERVGKDEYPEELYDNTIFAGNA